MTDWRAAELEAHDRLRAAIRDASVALCRRKAEEEGEDPDEGTLAQVEQGVLVDYVVVAAFDDLSDGSTSTAVLRTDGKCTTYRVLGLLELAAADTARG